MCKFSIINVEKSVLVAQRYNYLNLNNYSKSKKLVNLIFMVLMNI